MPVSPLGYALWLATRAPPRAEIMRGLRKAKLIEGGLEAPAILPGQQLRAGGYAEDRTSYTQELFAPTGEEPRTVHLGVDVFAPLNAEVFAPLDARVHSFRDNANPGDYGPCIILEHAAEGITFHTLYGHLSRASLEGLSPGKSFKAGERIAKLGGPEENGGWTPHLHFQIILDLKGFSGDYPGVAKRSESTSWLAICPDPAPFLGLPDALAD
jgi:murein DD-endopeptidase MepM/ murein hydrolase activator NlpD